MAKAEKLALTRLTPVEAKAVRIFTRALRERFPQVTKLILFGSKARGDSEADSDIDVLVIVRREDWRLSNAISALAARISLEEGVLLGPIIIGQERWERMGQEQFSLYRNVVRDGLVLTEGGVSSTAG